MEPTDELYFKNFFENVCTYPFILIKWSAWSSPTVQVWIICSVHYFRAGYCHYCKSANFEIRQSTTLNILCTVIHIPFKALDYFNFSLYFVYINLVTSAIHKYWHNFVFMYFHPFICGNLICTYLYI